MKNEFFEDLKQSMTEGLDHARGKREGLRETTLPRPPKKLTSFEIAGIRSKTKLSQSVFAMYLNVSVKTVQAWEQGSRTPSDAALKLLSIANDRPEAIFETK
jgi:putative transcriptional regulator